MTSIILLGLLLSAQADGTRCISKETDNLNISFSSTGTLIAWISSSGNYVRFWDAKANKALPPIKWKYEAALESIALSPDGKTIALEAIS
jgi:WD40 repeat protein